LNFHQCGCEEEYLSLAVPDGWGLLGQKTLSASDLAQLVNLVIANADRTGRTASEVIEWLESVADPQQHQVCHKICFGNFVDRIRRLRLRRNELAGADLFRDPAWDMLLELYAAHVQGRTLSVSSLCYASGVPITTALRQLQRLERHKMLKRLGDMRDNRRCLVEATPLALATVSKAAATLIQTALQAAEECREELHAIAEGQALFAEPAPGGTVAALRRSKV
jgi:DNA-binding MarR family transcriptional regulator